MNRTITVIYGNDIRNMTRRLLEAECNLLPSDHSSSIIIKPNLVTLSDPENGAVTHTEIVEETVSFLQDRNYRNITIAEGSWIGGSTEACFRHLGYYELASKYGIKLLDTKKDEYTRVSPCGIGMEVSRTVLEADFIINIPVLKGHCQTQMTHAMKNLKGVLSDKSKRDFHRLGLDKPIAALNTVIKPDLNISDSICGDLDFEEGGNPVRTDRMMIGSDVVLLDAYSATLMGFSPDDIGYIREAGKLGMLESTDWKIKELSKPAVAKSQPTGIARKLSEYTDPSDACSACYASLIHALKRLDDENLVRKLEGKRIAIGQGWRGKSPEIGCGACCSKASVTVPGCPAKADDILQVLRSIL